MRQNSTDNQNHWPNDNATIMTIMTKTALRNLEELFSSSFP